MVKTIKKIWNFINSILLGLLILLAVALVGVRFVGLDLYVVLSGSMEPTYKTGSVIYVKEVDTAGLVAGDVITFKLDDDTVATHRVIEVTEYEGELAFRTKGDANEMEDASAVLARQVVGSPIFTIPELGYLVSYIHTASGRYAIIAVGATLLLLMFLPDILFEEEAPAKDKKKKDEDEEVKPATDECDSKNETKQDLNQKQKENAEENASETDLKNMDVKEKAE